MKSVITSVRPSQNTLTMPQRITLFLAVSVFLHVLFFLFFVRFLPALPVLDLKPKHVIEVTLITEKHKTPPKTVHPPRHKTIVRATPKAASGHKSAQHRVAVHPSLGKKQVVRHTTPHPKPKAVPKPIVIKHATIKPERSKLQSLTPLHSDKKNDPAEAVKKLPPKNTNTDVTNPLPHSDPADKAPPGKQTDPAGEGTTGTGTGDTGDKTGDSGGQGNGYGPFGIGNGNGEGPRHIVFVIDVSGSMVSRIERVKSEMSKSLDGLEPGESFTMLAFGDRVQTYDASLEDATPANVAQAKYWLSTLTLQEGTDLQAGLYQALDTDGVNVIVVMTDGVPTEGETDFDKIAKNIRKRNKHIGARIYTVAMIGKNPDGTDDSFEAAKLLQRLAKDSHGDYALHEVGTATPD
jgi:hypothetical protein